MAHQLVLHLHLVLAQKLCRAVLELGGAKPPVRGVILPVDEGRAAAKEGGKLLDQRGIHPGVGVEGLFDVDDEGLAAPLRKRQGNELLPAEQSAADEEGLIHQFQHFLGQLQLIPGGLAVGLGELRLVILPELLHGGSVLRCQPPHFRLRPLGAEFFDVVALTGIPPPGEKLQVLFVVHIVPPGPVIADAHVGVAGEEMAHPALRHHRVVEGHALGGAPLLNGLQSLVHIPLGTGNGIIKAVLAICPVAHHQTPTALRPVGVQRLAPHEPGAGGVFAKAVVAVFIVAAQEVHIPLGNGFEV